MVKTLEEQKEEAKYWWTCSFCGTKDNEGTTDECHKCKGVRKTA